MADNVAPNRELDAFNCPHCGAFAHQVAAGAFANTASGFQQTDPLSLTQCSRCHRWAVWDRLALVFPLMSTAPIASEDMPNDVAADFDEAREIVGRSPRGAAALLRLAIQKLMPHLDQPGKDLNVDIGNLVKEGLPKRIQQALDAVRVIGNNAVHPGEIDLRDDHATADSLFRLVNMIVAAMITEPREVEDIYAKLPDGARSAVTKRDRTDATPS